jgi:hypothetical protein
MSGCCGRRPAPSIRSTGAARAPRVAASPIVAAPAAAAIAPRACPRFRYTGPSALQVVGPRSGRRYQFAHHGDEIDVDPRDAVFLAAVPRLIRV